MFLILAAGNLANLVNLHVADVGKTGELRIWLVICFAVLLPYSWLGIIYTTHIKLYDKLNYTSILLVLLMFCWKTNA